jgi:hypothetical protein
VGSIQELRHAGLLLQGSVAQSPSMSWRTVVAGGGRLAKPAAGS